MYISYKKWAEEVEKVKQAHGFKYLTRKRCRQVAGWTWHVEEKYQHWQVKIVFDNPAQETFYTLKWA